MGRTPQIRDIHIGQQFERLTLIGKSATGWLVRCTCGLEKSVSASDLVRGKAKSCGCRRREKKLAPGVEATNYLFDKYQRQGKERGHAWGLSREQFEILIRQSCHYCGLLPSNCIHRKRDVLTYSGIDRKDNLIGYVSSNVVTCCRTCNFLKKKTNYSEWVEYLNRVATFRTKRAFGVSA